MEEIKTKFYRVRDASLLPHTNTKTKVITRMHERPIEARSRECHKSPQRYMTMKKLSECK